MVGKKWIYKDAGETSLVEKLAAELSVEKSLAQLLVQRGVTSFEEARRWFRPSLEHLHDPFLMKDMRKAVDRLKRAIATGQKILVYGDYDVDGTTAVSLVILFLGNMYDKVAYYIPDRYTEGYGLSTKGVEYAREHGFALIVALDCGIKANKQIEHAQALGIDVIVCDHHHEGSQLPPASAILNPKQHDCEYPFKELSGCGVAFKFIQAYCIDQDIPIERLYEYLDLVAISIASDIVNITGENRVLSYFGIKKIIENPLVGIDAIKEIASIKDSLSVSDIVFKIGPRINAAGRIDSGSIAVELLTSSDRSKARELVTTINGCNETRKNLDKQITEEALQQIERDPRYADKKTTVVFDKDWHKGVVGIVASRLTEMHYRPTVVLTESNGKITGSARSVDGFDLYAAIEQCADLLENFGGHMYAAGLTLKADMLDAFKKRFDEAVSASILPDMLVPKMKIDLELFPTSINDKFFRIMKQFEPFGPGNMTPVFSMKGLVDTGYSRPVGDGSHLKLTLASPVFKSSFDGIAFGLGKMSEDIKNKSIDICFTLEDNTFRGETRLQINVRDLKIAGS